MFLEEELTSVVHLRKNAKSSDINMQIIQIVSKSTSIRKIVTNKIQLDTVISGLTHQSKNSLSYGFFQAQQCNFRLGSRCCLQTFSCAANLPAALGARNIFKSPD